MTGAVRSFCVTSRVGRNLEVNGRHDIQRRLGGSTKKVLGLRYVKVKSRASA